MVNSLVARGGCRQTVARPLPGQGSWPGTSKNPYPANWAGVPDGPCRGWEAGRVPQKTRTRQTWQTSLTAPAGYLKNPYSENSKARTRQTWQASLTPRGLGKYQNAPLNVSEASESIKTRRWRFPRGRKASKHAAERFRRLGKHQNTPLNVSDASEGSKHTAEDFRGLGSRPDI